MATSSIPPASSFLPRCPVALPPHEPRKSSVTPHLYLSDKDPDNAHGHPDSWLHPFPQGEKVKWMTNQEIAEYLVSQGYDRDLASSLNNIVERINYLHLRPYYMHKEQARRNEARRLARLKAEKLVGTQTPPAQEEG